jgi:predicted nucleic-acid-binding protein
LKKAAEVIPDTNVLLRYLLNDVPEQYAAAETFFERVRAGQQRAIILEAVLIECVYILTRQYNATRSDAAAALIGLLQYKGIANPDKGVLIDALDRFAATKLDPVDCLLLARAVQGGLNIFTFDKELAKAVERS